MTPQGGPVTHEPKSETILYTAPGTCGRATAIALYEANIPFQPSLVRFKAREHKAAEFIAKNPQGKVPVLAIDGATLFSLDGPEINGSDETGQSPGEGAMYDVRPPAGRRAAASISSSSTRDRPCRLSLKWNHEP